MRERLLLLVCTCLLGCGGGVQSIAERNRTFYEYDLRRASRSDYEKPYPPLDLKPLGPLPQYEGISILHGNVHISRPIDWIIKSASNEPGKRYIQYISPNEYIFAVYEWPLLPDTPWPQVLSLYEEQLRKAKAELVESRIPVATWNSQGRAYVIRRTIPAARAPLVNMSREFLTRNENRIVLVQIVHQGGNLEPIMPELNRVIQTLSLR